MDSDDEPRLSSHTSLHKSRKRKLEFIERKERDECRRIKIEDEESEIHQLRAQLREKEQTIGCMNDFVEEVQETINGFQRVTGSEVLLLDSAEGDSPLEGFQKQVKKLLGESFVAAAKLDAQKDQIEVSHHEKFEQRTRHEREINSLRAQQAPAHATQIAPRVPSRVPSGYTYLDTDLAIELPAELPGSEPEGGHHRYQGRDDLQRQIYEQAGTIGQRDATIFALKRDINILRAAQTPQQDRVDQLELNLAQERARTPHDQVRHWREMCDSQLNKTRKLEHELQEERHGENFQHREWLKSRVDAQGATIARLQEELEEKTHKNSRLASEHTTIQNAIAGLNVQLNAVSTSTPAPSAAPSNSSPALRSAGLRGTLQERLKALNEGLAQNFPQDGNSQAGTPAHYARPSSVNQRDAEAIARAQTQPPGPNPVRSQDHAINRLLARDSFTPFNTISDRRSEADESGYESTQRTPAQITPAVQTGETLTHAQGIESSPRGHTYHGYCWRSGSVEMPPGAPPHNLPPNPAPTFQSPNLQRDRTPAAQSTPTQTQQNNIQPQPAFTQPQPAHIQPSPPQPTQPQPTRITRSQTQTSLAGPSSNLCFFCGTGQAKAPCKDPFCARYRGAR